MVPMIPQNLYGGRKEEYSGEKSRREISGTEEGEYIGKRK